MAEKQGKVEVVVLKTFTAGRKRYPMWTHQMMTEEKAAKYVGEGKAKYAKR
ncbi:MAG: hypothetical protein PUF10_02860 [Bacteroidales bacterium]|nr:hypothetical protein [Bacteroidales bacterium]